MRSQKGYETCSSCLNIIQIVITEREPQQPVDVHNITKNNTKKMKNYMYNLCFVAACLDSNIFIFKGQFSCICQEARLRMR